MIPYDTNYDPPALVLSVTVAGVVHRRNTTIILIFTATCKSPVFISQRAVTPAARNWLSIFSS